MRGPRGRDQSEMSDPRGADWRGPSGRGRSDEAERQRPIPERRAEETNPRGRSEGAERKGSERPDPKGLTPWGSGRVGSELADPAESNSRGGGLSEGGFPMGCHS